jgi:hypothetical protein
VIDEFLPKLEELVERSKGKITGMGYAGSGRTTRRAVAGLKRAYTAGRRRVHRPWVAEPGMWAQYDFGDGPRIGGAATVLFCWWLAWSLFRVVIPLLGKTWPSVAAAAGVALRRLGGVPACLLTDYVARNTIGVVPMSGQRRLIRRRDCSDLSADWCAWQGYRLAAGRNNQRLSRKASSGSGGW